MLLPGEAPEPANLCNHVYGQLYPLKMKLVRLLHGKRIPAKKIRLLMNFLRYHLLFQNPEINIKFEQEIEPITGRRNTMGIEEQLLDLAWKEGHDKGIEQGIEQSETRIKEMKVSKEISFVQSLIRHTDFDNKKIASLAGVSMPFVEKIRISLLDGA